MTDTANCSTEPTPDYSLSWQKSDSKGKVILRCERDKQVILVDEINPTRSKDRQAIKDVLTTLGCDPTNVGNELLSIADQFASSNVSTGPTTTKESSPLSQLEPSAIAEAQDILTNCESILELTYQDATAVGIVGEESTVLALYLAGVSRLLTKPINVIVQGSSSSGKSYLIDAVSELFPESTKVVAQQMTPNALYYLPEGSLKNRIVVAGERSRVEDDDRAEATRALREMLSAGHLKKLVTGKDSLGRLATETIYQAGPISFWESTTLGEIFDEDRNRCIVIHTDESKEQTLRILLSLAKGHSRGCIDRQHAMQLLIEPKLVEVPYAESIARLLPATKVESRRAFGHLLTCIRASALLHQQQRQSTESGSIVANESDYATAYALMAKPMAESIGRGVSDVATEFWDWIARWYPRSETFVVQDLLNRSDCPKARDRTYSLIAELQSSKCLAVVPSSGKAKVLRIDRSPSEADCPLPEPALVFSSTSDFQPESRKEVKSA